MATPNIPQKNGSKVVSRTFDWRSMVVSQWGEEWNRPDTAYVWSEGRRFDCTDQYTSGIYRRS